MEVNCSTVKTLNSPLVEPTAMTEDDPEASVVDTSTVRQSYDEIARAYAESRSAGTFEIDLLQSFVDGLPEDATILDAGCGQGSPVLERLCDAGTAIGLDFSREQLRLANTNAATAALLQADLTRLPLATDSVDAVVAFHSIIHIPLSDHQRVIDEFARVLRPGGQLLLTEGLEEWTGSNPDWLDAGAEMQWEIAGVDRTRAQLEAAGFELVEEIETEPEPLGESEHWVYLRAVRAG